jgi:hypothetical protein
LKVCRSVPVTSPIFDQSGWPNEANVNSTPRQMADAGGGHCASLPGGGARSPRSITAIVVVGPFT